MRTVMLVSPSFPPSDAVDMHRVRMSLPYWEGAGWRAVVLAVDPSAAGLPTDSLLIENVPAEIEVTRVDAFPLAWTRRAGVTNLGLRAFRSLLLGGRRILSRKNVDLIFISTTHFLSMPLGRMWKREFGVPFVLDLQDPWVPSAGSENGVRRGLKHALARAMHRKLETWTMADADGLVSVTAAYTEELAERYPHLRPSQFLTSPFGAALQDLEIAGRVSAPAGYFDPNDGQVHGVFTGALGEPKRALCRSICSAIRIGLREEPALFSRLRLHFIGSSYAADGAKTIAPVARELGVERHVSESSARVRYFEALGLLRNAQFGVILGSDDRQYVPSKLFLYLAAGKPLLCLMNGQSAASRLLRDAKVESLVTFDRGDEENLPAEIARRLASVLRGTAGASAEGSRCYSAEAMTRDLAAFFDTIVRR